MSGISHQAERLYATFAELARRYQFRDREQICCHGLSVSQCYTLEALVDHDAMTMGEIAGRLCLEISTVTRVVDVLVEAGHVRRRPDPTDRRICRIELTARGRALVSRVRSGIVAEYEDVLRQVAPESREAVIGAVSHLLAAFRKRQPSQTPTPTRTRKARRDRRVLAGASRSQGE